MKEIGFPEFRAKCSAILEHVRKTRRPIRLIHLGEPLAEIVPVSLGKGQPDTKTLRKKSPRASKAHPRR
jgi:hypothetical protein